MGHGDQGHGQVLQTACLTQKGNPELAQKPDIDRSIGKLQQQDKSAESLSLCIYRRRILQLANPFSSRVQVRILRSTV